MPAWIAFIATVIFPGTGHLLRRRYLKGAMLSALFAASVDVFLIASDLFGQGVTSPVSLVSAALAVGVWVYGLIDLVRMLRLFGAGGFQERKDALLREAQVAWLKDDLTEAERLLRAVLDIDERDVEAWVHLGKVLKSSGRAAEARKCFRSALNLSDSRRWRWELMRELGLVDIKTPETRPD